MLRAQSVATTTRGHHIHMKALVRNPTRCPTLGSRTFFSVHTTLWVPHLPSRFARSTRDTSGFHIRTGTGTHRQPKWAGNGASGTPRSTADCFGTRHTTRSFVARVGYPVGRGLVLAGVLQPRLWNIAMGVTSEEALPTNTLLQTTPRTEPDPPVGGIVDFLLNAARFIWNGIALVLRATELLIRFAPVIMLAPLSLNFMPEGARDFWFRVLCYTLRHSGACFIKLGQWLSTRRDLISERLCERLSSLRSQAPIHSYAHTKKAIETAFAKTINELFSEFSMTPIASGAIAQVYRAKLLIPVAGVSDVAVKVRHPYVDERIHRDLVLLKALVSVVEVVGRMSWMNLRQNVITFSQRMHAQCDLDVEAQNLLQFRRNFADSPAVRFPLPIQGLSHPLVLVESFETGSRLENYLGSNVPTKIKTAIANVGMDAFLKMIAIDNFVHADLHPGNILVDVCGTEGTQIVFLDAGLVTVLAPKDRNNFVDLFTAVLQNKPLLAAELITAGQGLPRSTVEQFGADISVLIDHVQGGSLGDVSLSHVFINLLNSARVNRILIEPNFTTLVVGAVVVEGIGRQLNPNLNILQRAAPLFLRAADLRERYIKSTLGRLIPWLNTNPTNHTNTNTTNTNP
eukprot:TRINITY_DN3007_c1_g1_i1.p1 TRINITY_DN3007_c1_g1~~TRINITY_DN3007_c1_g1_i1.p1  ORF type:complete len:627 (+),score=41.03 TRINITY_DN3007_c1_g1_i1:43-1923(+)